MHLRELAIVEDDWTQEFGSGSPERWLGCQEECLRYKMTDELLGDRQRGSELLLNASDSLGDVWYARFPICESCDACRGRGNQRYRRVWDADEESWICLADKITLRDVYKNFIDYAKGPTRKTDQDDEEPEKTPHAIGDEVSTAKVGTRQEAGEDLKEQHKTLEVPIDTDS